MHILYIVSKTYQTQSCPVRWSYFQQVPSEYLGQDSAQFQKGSSKFSKSLLRKKKKKSADCVNKTTIFLKKTSYSQINYK